MCNSIVLASTTTPPITEAGAQVLAQAKFGLDNMANSHFPRERGGNRRNGGYSSAPAVRQMNIPSTPKTLMKWHWAATIDHGRLKPVVEPVVLILSVSGLLWRVNL
jgi:homogentisate 1,2-dioxygenase